MASSTAKSVRTAHATRTTRSAHRVATRTARRQRVAVAVPRPVVVRVSGTRLTARGRLVLLLALVGLLLVGFSLGRSRTEAATTTSPSPAVTQTTVQVGESLWTVARRVSPGTDPRATVQQLRRLNHLSGSGLQAGQQLLLPA